MTQKSSSILGVGTTVYLFFISGVFGYYLFYWNWKIITESTVDKGKS